MRTTEGFVREKRDGKSCLVRRTSSGGEVVKTGDEYSAYYQGKYMGWSADVDQAMHMATSGHPELSGIETASNLSLAAAWDDAVASGATVMLISKSEGTQAILLSRKVVMIAHPECDCELMSIEDFFDDYLDENGCLDVEIVSSENAHQMI